MGIGCVYILQFKKCLTPSKTRENRLTLNMFYFDTSFLTNKVWYKPIFPLYFAVHSFYWHKGPQKGKKCGCHHFIHCWGKAGGFGLTTWRWREIKIQATPKRLIAALCRSSWCATWYRVTRWLSDHSAFAGEMKASTGKRFCFNFVR